MSPPPLFFESLIFLSWISENYDETMIFVVANFTSKGPGWGARCPPPSSILPGTLLMGAKTAKNCATRLHLDTNDIQTTRDDRVRLVHWLGGRTFIPQTFVQDWHFNDACQVKTLFFIPCVPESFWPY